MNAALNVPSGPAVGRANPIARVQHEAIRCADEVRGAACNVGGAVEDGQDDRAGGALLRKQERGGYEDADRDERDDQNA